jgi:hypothetical protein
MRNFPGVSVLIPTEWTPEQALAVLELLTDLRAALLTLHGEAICDYVDEQRQQSDDIIMPDDLSDDWDPPF